MKIDPVEQLYSWADDNATPFVLLEVWLKAFSDALECYAQPGLSDPSGAAANCLRHGGVRPTLTRAQLEQGLQVLTAISNQDREFQAWRASWSDVAPL